MKSSDFEGNSRFKHFLEATRMYTEMYSSKEGIASILLALVCTVVVCTATHYSEFTDLQGSILTLLGIALGGAFGLLGFLVGGLGILIGSISDNMISVIDKKNKFEYLLAIVFRFYFDGAILLLLIFISIFDILFILMPFEVNWILLIFLSLTTSYLFWYALMLSVMLLGTSIRLLILRHKFSGKQ